MTTLRRALRPLDDGEKLILDQVQDIYGPHNVEKRVHFLEDGSAEILGLDRKHQPVISVNLTKLSHALADGTIKSIDDLRRNWLYSYET